MNVHEYKPVSNVISTVVWGAEGWLLTDKIQTQLNGWNSRRVSNITDKTLHDGASVRKQSMCLPDIVRYRRMVWLGRRLDIFSALEVGAWRGERCYDTTSCGCGGL
jgi:hypothetical protein